MKAKLRAWLRQFYMLFTGERERSDYAVQYTKYWLARWFGRKSWIRTEWDGGQKLDSKDIVVFVHFEKNGIIFDFVLQYLDELAKTGRRILFVTNSPKFPDHERAKLQGRVERILWRHNKGYDFGAYADGVRSIKDIQELDSLLLCNDSVYGPFFPLTNLFKAMSSDKADIWAMTDSWDTRYHLQSYFLLFHKKAITDPFFIKRWQEYVHVQSKSWVIRKHEIGLTADANKAGLRTHAQFRYRDQLSEFNELVRNSRVLEDENLSASHRHILAQIIDHAEHGRPLNGSHFFWDQLILCGYPFIKRELLQGNPMGLPSLYKWEGLLKAKTSYDTELINDHLEVVMRGKFM